MQQRAAQLTAVPLLLALALSAPAEGALQVHLLGAPADLSPSPQIDEGVVLGAPASIVGRLGCRFMSEDGHLTILTPGGRRVVLQEDSDELLVDGQRRRLPREAFVSGERLICPLRPVLEAIGCIVSITEDCATLDISVPVESIEVFADDQGARVAVRAPLRIAGKVAYLEAPARWYVDLGGARVHLEHSVTYVNLGEVLRVRWGQFDTRPSVARVVADLRGKVPVRWAPYENGLGGELILGQVQGDEPRIERRVPKVTRMATTTPGENTTVVRVELSDPVPISYDVQRTPPRVYVEMPDAAPEMPIAPVAAEGPFVKTVRLDGRAGRPGATLELSMHQLVQFEVRETDDPPAVNVIFRRERLQDQRIVIDPGHGGRDTGALGRHLREKDVNLDVAKQVVRRLLEAGAQPLLTRESDVFVDLYDRPELANRIDADLFVSIHCNAMPRPNTGWGTETYYYHAHSKCLGLIMQAELVRTLDRRDNGLRWANFCVTRESDMPAVLVELMYLNTDEEEALLAKPEVRTAAAEAIVEGLRQYVEGTGSVAERTGMGM